MQANLQRIRGNNHVTTVTNSSLKFRSRRATSICVRRQAQPSPALVYLPPATDSATPRNASHRTLACSRPQRWPLKDRLNSWSTRLGPVGKGRLGQDGTRRCFSSTNTSRKRERNEAKAAASLRKIEPELVPDDPASWKRLFAHMRLKHGVDGTWACFELLRERHRLHLILREGGSKLREEIVDAASVVDKRVETLREVVVRLRSFSQTWPNFHVNFLHSLLRREDYGRALEWHTGLSRHSSLGPEALGGLFSRFITDPRPEMQDALTSIYDASNVRRLYDIIIPVLYNSGNSRLAREWRKKLIEFGDHPSSLRSIPFLDFLSRYYPRTRLTPQEVALVDPGRCTEGEYETEDGPGMQHNTKKGIYSDRFLAKWFASTWLSVEFVLNFVHRMGLEMVGPLSLQALALREPDAEAVAARISHLDKLDIRVAPQTYCKALVFFARSGEDELLNLLLQTDIHPDEFDNPKTRHRILTAAVERKDPQREELLEGIEWAVRSQEAPDYLNDLLRNMLKRGLGKAKLVIDRMAALKVKISQRNADILLDHAFQGVGKHPTRWKRKVPPGVPDAQLDRAIYITRRISSHGVAIPVQYWSNLIYSLGRLGRFEELLQLSLEFVRLYKPPIPGLIPVHRQDAPEITSTSVDPFEVEMLRGRPDQETSPERRGGSEYEELKDAQHIPSDLSFTHRHHPVQLVFDRILQQNILRWGFDQTLLKEPAVSASMDRPANRLADFDIACGVRILASLRDEGVLIDRQVLRSRIATRIILGELPSRRHRLRDDSDVSTEHVKRLVDAAWGSEVLPRLPELNKVVEKQRPGVWEEYPLLFQNTFRDRDRSGSELELSTISSI